MINENFAQDVEALKSVLEALAPLNEEQRRFVINAAIDRLKLNLPPAASLSSLRDEQSKVGTVKPHTVDKSLSPKEFIRLKQPFTVVEQITCLAYYLTQTRGMPHFKTADLIKLNTEAAAPRISNSTLFARNAVSPSGYLALAGGGKKQISALGEAIVEAMPDREKVKQILSNDRKRPRRGGKRKVK